MTITTNLSDVLNLPGLVIIRGLLVLYNNTYLLGTGEKKPPTMTVILTLVGVFFLIGLCTGATYYLNPKKNEAKGKGYSLLL